jgi:AcrR family transcriptional regulator
MAKVDPPSPTPSRAERLRDRSAARREAQRGQLRELLLTVAEQQLREKGYGAFSLREVAESTGYTPTTIYRYFRDRDALIEAVLQQWFVLFAQALDQAAQSETRPAARLLALGDAYLRFALAQPERYRVMFVERPDIGLLPDAGSHLRDDPAFGVLIRAAESLCDAGQAGGHEPMQVAMMLWLSLHGVAALAVVSPILDDRAAVHLGKELAKTLLGGLQSPS